MKKIILLSIGLFVGLMSFAQTPRYGYKPNQDNTGRVLTFGYTSFAGGNFTVTGSQLNYKETNMFLNLTTTSTISGKSLNTGKFGDNLRIHFASVSGTNIYTFQNIPTTATGFKFVTNGAYTLTGTKLGNIIFISDGQGNYIEQSRFVQP